MHPAISDLKHKDQEQSLSMQKINNKWCIALLCCSSAFFLMFSLLGIWHHWGYLTSINDLGVFDQATWQASRGNSLIINMTSQGVMNYLGIHFQPILYIFTPLYRIFPSVYWLIFSQSAAISFSAIPIFLIADHISGSKKTAFIWTIIYLLNPFLLAAAACDFQPGILVLLFLSLGLLAIVKKHPMLLISISIALLACKEHMGLAVAGLGFLYGLINKKWIVGAVLIAIGLSTLILVIGVIMPHYSLTGQHTMLNSANDARYKWLGSSLSAVIKKLILDPLEVIKIIFLDMDGSKYIFWLLTPFLFLPLGGFYWILPSFGDLLANLLSANPMPRSLFSYHSATIIPLLTVSAIYGLQNLRPYLKIFSIEGILKILLVSNLILAYYFSPFPLPGAMNFWQPVSTPASFDKRELIVKDNLRNESFSVQANLGAHFSQRASFFIFPEKIGIVDTIVLKLDSPTKRLSPDDRSYVGTLAHHLHMTPAIYLNHVEKLLISKDYEPVYWNDPWLVLSKGQTHQSPKTLQQIRTKLLMLRKEWTQQ